MAVTYEYLGRTTKPNVVVMPEPEDLYKPTAQDVARALNIIENMDKSNKWARTDKEPTKVPDWYVEKYLRQDVKPSESVVTASDEGLGPIDPGTSEDAPESHTTASLAILEEPDSPPSQAEVRRWAEANGVQVSKSGRIAKAVVDKYLSATRG